MIDQNVNSRYSMDSPRTSIDSACSDVPTMQQFKQIDSIALLKIIERSSDKFCMLDPAPTWIIKNNTDICINLLLEIIN